MTRVRGRFLVVLLAALSAGACSETAAPPVPTALAASTSPAPSATVGAAVAAGVKVTDEKGKPMKGVAVQFETSGGGSVTAASAVTDALGVATPGTWTLGTTVGPNTLTARSGSLTPVIFTVSTAADAPAAAQPATGNTTAGSAGAILTTAPGVRVLDRHGNPVAGASVTFSTSFGTVAGATQSTNTDGVARPTSWTLGGIVGTQTLVANVGTVSTSIGVTVSPGPASTIVAVSGTGQTANIAVAVPVRPSVRVTDAFGNAVVGATVQFTVTSGGGSVTGAAQSTDANGNAAVGSWTLGTAGENRLTAAIATGANVVFTATAVDPAAMTIEKFAGDNTTCPVGAASCLFSVRVRNGAGQAAAGQSVVWTNGANTQTTTTNAQGRSTITATFNAAGAGVQRARLSTGTEVSFNYQVVQAGQYNIDMRFIGTPTAGAQLAFQQAKAKWEGVITGDLQPRLNFPAGSCGGVQYPGVAEIDDLVVFIEIVPIDGPGQILGQAGACNIRSNASAPGPGLPFVGIMKLDSADVAVMEQQGRLRDVVTHELGHVLGVGSLWNYAPAGFQFLAGAGTNDVAYTGVRAVSGFVLGGGTLFNGGAPVENTGGQGTADVHWRETTFANELMTGFIGSSNNPLSIMTIGSLLDLGYQVNFGAADTYIVPGGVAGLWQSGSSIFDLQLREVPMPRPRIEY